MMTSFDKAIVAFLAPIVLTGLLALGVTGDMTVTDAVNNVILGLFTGISVYLTRNKVK